MTIFIIDNPITTASILDKKRFNKQIIECQWMINMAEGRTKESHHPAYLMYKDHIEWVKLYKKCFEEYRKNNFDEAKRYSEEAGKIRPAFLTPKLYNNFKKRLYEKDPEYYKLFEHHGKTKANYYYVNGQWLKYEDGKKYIVDEIE